jgi:hypothetical protein
MARLNIDGKEYDFDTLSEDAKKQISSIQFVDKKIAELQAELAVVQTARNAYSKTLVEMLPGPKKSKQ